MLNKEYRLKKNKHFIYIFKNGLSKHSKHLSLIYIKTKIKPFKVGFTVSKKIGNSVIRNKTKRRLSEAFKFYIKNIEKSYNYIFLAKEGISLLTFNEIKIIMKELLIKAGLYKDE